MLRSGLLSSSYNINLCHSTNSEDSTNDSVLQKLDFYIIELNEMGAEIITKSHLKNISYTRLGPH